MKNNSFKLLRLPHSLCVVSALAHIFFLSIALNVSTARAAATAITPIGPFAGELSENWESFPPHNGSRNWLPNGTSIMQGNATIESAKFLGIYTCCFPNNAGLGLYDDAPVTDGAKALIVESMAGPIPVSATIRFNTPVNKFGGYWGCWAGQPSPLPTITVTFNGAGGTTIGTDTFTYAGGGSLIWHGWVSSVPISAVSFTGTWPVNDGLQAAFWSNSPPTLTIERSGGGARISWPLSAADCMLEQTSALEFPPAATMWSEIPPPYESDGTVSFITVPATTGNTFFRLRKP